MNKNIFTVLALLIISSNIFAQNSVLSSGNWYKISTSKDAVHKISYADLQSYGINPSTLDPRNIKIYGNGAGMLEQANYEPKTDDLEEVAIKVVGESDGVFNTNDYILFYGQGADKWSYDYTSETYSHEKNLFNDNTFYFITVGTTNGKRITTQNSSISSVTNTSVKYDNLIFHELDNVNLLQSGRMWFGEIFDTQLSYAYNYNISNLDLSSAVTINSSVVARSQSASQVEMNSNGNITTIPILNVNTTCYSCKYAEIGSSTMSFIPSSTNIPLTLTYDKPTSTSIAWLDYFELITRNNLLKNSNQLIFRDKENVGAGNVSKFQIENTLSTDFVWEITEHNNVVEQNKTFSSGITEFTIETDLLKEFVIFDLTNLSSPVFVTQVNNQNLHAMTSPDMVIVTHPNFVSAANILANFHLNNDGIISEVVTTEQIYNEFSSGAQDITAINDFMEYLYKQSNSSLKYLLLLGDGSYDYKNRITSNTNFVPTYQTENSLDVIGSIASDDYYGLLDSSDGTWNGTEYLDIAIGRLPVKTIQEANDVVNKIIDYKTNTTSFDNWRKTITFIGDDEDGKVHMSQADFLSDIVQTSSCQHIVEKIYLDEYTQVVNGSQQSYPEVEEKIVNSFRRGSLIMNYTGHGGNNQLAHENILNTTSLDTLNNSNYPLLILATSESSRYDNPAFTSFGEQYLLKPNAGSIASFSTTRLGYSTPNFYLNKSVYNTIFTKVNDKYKTLGEVFKEVKNLNATNTNNRNFTLLGDPALTLNFPEFVINANHPDTLQNSSLNTIVGQIEDDNGVLQNWFSGDLIVFIQGNVDTIVTLANDGGSPFVFYDRRDVVYYDTIPVVNGLFSFNVNLNTAPVHIKGDAKINYYAFNGMVDASGCNDSIFINDVMVGVNEYSTSEKGVIIFPNPADDNFTIEGSEKPYDLTIQNYLGQVLYKELSVSGSSKKIDVSNYKPGLIIVRIESEGRASYYKVLKQ